MWVLVYLVSVSARKLDMDLRAMELGSECYLECMMELESML